MTYLKEALSKEQTSGLAFLSFVFLMTMVFAISPLAIDMYLPAFPAMAQSLNTSISAIEATIAVYLLFFAFGQFVFGAFADRYNKANLLSFGLLLFVIATVGLVYVESATGMYAWRALQAFSAGTSIVVLPLIHQTFNPLRANQALSYIMAGVVLTPMISPFIGSLILVEFGWRQIFWALAIYAFVALVILKSSQKHPILSKGIKKALANKNNQSVLHGYQEVFSNPMVLLHVFSGGFAFAGMFAFIAGSPYVYIEFFNLTPVQYGQLVMLNAVAMIAGNLINARLLHDIEPTKKLILGGKMLALISAYLIIIDLLSLDFSYLVIGIVCFVGTLGLTAANATSGAMKHAGQHSGIAAGINGVLQFGTGAIATTLISIIPSNDANTMSLVMAMFGLLSFVTVMLLHSHSSAVAAHEEPTI